MKRIIVLAAALALIAAACGSADADTTTTPEPATTAAPATAAPVETTAPPTTTAPAETSPPETSQAGATVAVASSPLGDILVDSEGKTLYLFLPDEQGDSTCYDQCADNWPPLTAAITAGDGADATLLGTATRTDGAEQVTYNGWPLYYFAADAAPGDTNGQGINDVWFVVTAAGESIQ